ncbi:hypothetical protein [Chthonobacter rhizosphaerae]|uniref:hypothetical protein n=1 Tax=Chthonobacter rhizosphaerae TaxID=2735553 RepID=UPI0015EEB938|nr:hypothetical protein [Chthonobacter rhizosphaerae]
MIARARSFQSPAGPTVDVAAPLVVLFAISVVALPKAGVLVGGDVPIYASVIVGQIVSAVGWLLAVRHFGWSVEKIGLALILVASVIWLGHVLSEASGGVQARRAARLFFLFLPLTGLGVYYFMKWIRIDDEFLHRSILFAFYFLIAYSLLQLLFGADQVAIQYVTANYVDEFDEIITRSNVIHRLGGETYKLFSTYQNGNLFSIALIILFPIVFSLEKNIYLRYVSFIFLHIVVLYSASTTSYISLLIIDLLFVLFFARRYLVAVIIVALVLFSLVLALSLACDSGECGVVDLLSAKLFERDLTDNMRWLKTDMWLSRMSDNIAIVFIGEMSNRSIMPVYEVLPFSIAQYYGIFVLVGFYAFIIAALGPWKLRLYKVGLVAYLVTSFGSGGFWLTPTPYLIGFSLGLVARLDRSRHPVRVASTGSSFA